MAEFGIRPEVWEAVPQEVRVAFIEHNLGAANARHASHRSEDAAADGQAWAAAHSMVKTLMAVNAGAVVAILAFLGSMIQAKATLWITPVAVSLISFVTGAAFAVAAGFVAYFAGSALVSALRSEVCTFRAPYVFGTEESHVHTERYNALRWIGVGLCVASGLAAVLGSAAFLTFAVSSLK